MRYVEARIEEFDREEAYRIYVTKSLQLAPQQGYIKESYYDIMSEKTDTRTADEITIDIFKGAELRFKEDECI